MQQRHTTPSSARDQLVAFLDSHLGVAYRDDVGPLLGEVAMMRDSAVFTAALAVDANRDASGHDDIPGARKSSTRHS